MEDLNSSKGKQVQDFKTKTDSKLEATQQLYKSHNQLNNIKIELKLYALYWMIQMLHTES